jgi:hypothetical protein
MKIQLNGWTGSITSVAKPPLHVKLNRSTPGCCRERFRRFPHPNHQQHFAQKGYLPGMSDKQRTDAPDPSEPRIPSQLADHIRHLSHDLSNALEVILQTNYLLGMIEGSSGANKDSGKWREMLDQGVVQATEINRQLREYIRAHS